MIRKIILKFWLLNVLIGITLFIIYRVVISEKETTDTTLLETILAILLIFLDLGFSLIYLVGMIVSSLAIFLNFNDKVRGSFLLSLLSFLGIPVVSILYFLINLSLNQSITLFTTFLIFSLIYILMAGIEFLFFRKNLKQYQNRKKN